MIGSSPWGRLEPMEALASITCCCEIPRVLAASWPKYGKLPGSLCCRESNLRLRRSVLIDGESGVEQCVPLLLGLMVGGTSPVMCLPVTIPINRVPCCAVKQTVGDLLINRLSAICRWALLCQKGSCAVYSVRSPYQQQQHHPRPCHDLAHVVFDPCEQSDASATLPTSANFLQLLFTIVSNVAPGGLPGSFA